MATPKVTYNLDESPFYYETENLRFVFSSKSYLNKFEKRYIKKREDFFYFMKARFNIEVMAYDYADFMTYANLEIRGFKVVRLSDGTVISCLNEILLDGKIVTLKELTA